MSFEFRVNYKIKINSVECLKSSVVTIVCSCYSCFYYSWLSDPSLRVRVIYLNGFELSNSYYNVRTAVPLLLWF
jgi:hypothetical protein